MDTKKIWEKILIPGEEIKYEFSLGRRYIHLNADIFIILGIPLLYVFGLGLIFILTGIFIQWLLRRSNNYAFTNKRILILKGWLSTTLTSVDYDKITETRVEENFFEKTFLGIGHLIIDTAGTDAQEIYLDNIGNPYEVKRQLEMAEESAGLPKE